MFDSAAWALNSDDLGQFCPLDSPHGKIRLPEGVKRVWLDVGAHECQSTYAALLEDETLAVIAFEPLPGKFAALRNRHPRLIALPYAVSNAPGRARLYESQWDLASSLLAYNPHAALYNQGGRVVKGLHEVATVGLEPILERLSEYSIEWLKIDTRGHDLAVLESAGSRLNQVARIRLHAHDSVEPLYSGAAIRKDIFRSLTARGFALEAILPRAAEAPEEVLTFVRADRDRHKPMAVLWDIAAENLLQNIQEVHISDPSHPGPRQEASVWTFTPSNPRDHFATRFKNLGFPGSSGGREMVLQLYFPDDSTRDRVIVAVQDQDFNELVRTQDSTFRVNLPLSATVQSLRLVFLIPSDRDCYFPEQVVLWLTDPQALMGQQESARPGRTPLQCRYFPQGTIFENLTEFQAHYMDQTNGTLRPATALWLGPRRLMSINSLGCKGPELTSELPVLGCFGCSTTFGLLGESYADFLTLPGCQTLNAGVEGYSMERITARLAQLRRQVRFAGVIAYLGWHNLIYNRHDEDFWRQNLETFEGPHLTALCTIGTSLTPECLSRGLESLINTHPERRFDPKLPFERDYFAFWGNIPPLPQHISEILAAIDRYNQFVRQWAREKNWILIDLYPFLRPASYAAIPHEFYDICHPRPEVFPRIAGYISGVLQEPMARRLRGESPGAGVGGSPALHLEKGSPKTPAGEANPPSTSSGENGTWRQQIYPIW